MAKVDSLRFENNVLGSFDLVEGSPGIDLDAVFAAKSGEPSIGFVSPGLEVLGANR